MNDDNKDAAELASAGRLRAAIRCALAEQRSALRVSAGLMALGLATQPVLAATFPAEFELSSLQTASGGDGSLGFVLNGIDVADSSGHSVSTAGDVNGDGIDDLLVGAYLADPGGRDAAGETYVVFGRNQTAFPAEFELSSLLEANGGDGSAGFVLNGIDSSDLGGDFSGDSVSAAGDVNGDGIDDLLVGASGAAPGGRASGESYVVFGRDQAASGFPAELELSSLLPANGGDGSAGFVLNGIDVADRSGDSVSAAGDVNGDGIDDLLVGAPDADPGGRDAAGETYVIFGRDIDLDDSFPAEFELSSLAAGDGGAGFVLNGIDGGPFGDRSGVSVSAAGDVNGDGIDDLLVGAAVADPGGRNNAGETYVIFGRDIDLDDSFPAEFELSSLAAGDGSAGFVLNGIDDSDISGQSTSAAGDVNGDGIDDLLVGAKGADPGGRNNAGETYVIFGRDIDLDDSFPAEFELSSLAAGDGSAGFVLNGIDAVDRSGESVSEAGDVNGDGIDDLLVGALLADPGGRNFAGESYVVFGRDQTAFPAELELSSLQTANGGDGSAGFVLNGIDAYDYSGSSVSAAGDVNGDGIDDLLVGAVYAAPGGQVRVRAGETYVVFGRPTDGAVVLCDGIEATIVGTEAADAIIGTGARDVIHGLGGSDTIRGLGGDDLICGGEGEDSMNGNAGHDRMLGEVGNDDLFGGGGNDEMEGGDDNDQLFGNGGRDIMRGGMGNDRLFGKESNDQLFGDEGTDNLFGEIGNDGLFGGPGRDRLFGGPGNDDLFGGTGFDSCGGGDGSGDTATNCEQITNVP